MSTTAQPNGLLTLRRLSLGLLSMLSLFARGTGDICWSLNETVDCRVGETKEAEEGGGWKEYGEFRVAVETLLFDVDEDGLR